MRQALLFLVALAGLGIVGLGQWSVDQTIMRSVCGNSMPCNNLAVSDTHTALYTGTGSSLMYN